MDERPRYLSTFTGVGGADIGLERAGWVCAGACELDPWRRSVFLRHHPGVPVWDDIRAIGRGDAEVAVAERGTDDGRRADAGRDIDLLWGSPPCQDFSVAGRRAGIDGDRGVLMWEFLRVADVVVRPGAWLAMEQVPGVLSSNDGRDWGAFLWALADLGFHDVAWRVLDSRYFGVPQRRRRVFLAARRARGERAAEVLALTEGGGGHPAPGEQARAGDAGGAGGGAAVAGWSDGVTTAVCRKWAKCTSGTAGDEHHNLVVSALTRNMAGGGGGPDDNAAQAGHLVQVAPSLTSFNMDSRSPQSEDQQRIVRAVHDAGAGVRRLTPRECERLQGWPDDYTRWDADGREAPDSRRYAAIGDGVTAPVTEWIGRRLMEALS